MLEEGICEVWIFGYMRLKSTNLEAHKIKGVDVYFSEGTIFCEGNLYIDEM